MNVLVSALPFYALVLWCVGCGDGNSSSTPAANAEDATDQRPFVPGGITFDFIGSASEPVKLETSTLQSSGKGAYWLVSARNMGDQTACSSEVDAVFEGSGEETLAAAGAPIQAFPYDGYEETGCLAPGEVGLGAVPIDVAIPQVLTVRYQFGGWLPKAPSKITGVNLEGINIVSPDAEMATVRGRLNNGSTMSIDRAAVHVFSLNAVGRPLAVGKAAATAPLAAGSAWEFELSVTGPVKQYAAFWSFSR